MPRKHKHNRLITSDDLPESWEITRAAVRTDVMPSRVHDAGKTRRRDRRERRMRDRMDVRDLRMERDYV